jgi:glycosyltransferase involved in cell wall biosynthesis
MPVAPDIWLACHGPLECNSGQHVRSLAGALADRGFAVTVCVPERSPADAGLPGSIRLRSFADALRVAVDAPPRILHIWTARERMRIFHRDLSRRLETPVPHVIHLEDNESLLLTDQMRLTPDEFQDVRDGLRPLVVPNHLTHPLHGRQLIATAAGVTALVEPLMRGLPTGLPTAVFHPGYDPIFAPARPEAAAVVRRRLRIPADTAIVTYTGNVHPSNVDEVRSLSIAVALANRMGRPTTLVRTGSDHVPLTDLGADLLRQHTVELGTVPRGELPDLVHAADILVQPGRVDEWNMLRFPSKLPDYLVSGRPLMLPRVNLGMELDHGRNAIVLPEATAERIAVALVEWLPQRDTLAAIGTAGAEFARRSLTWSAAADVVEGLYRRILPPVSG